MQNSSNKGYFINLEGGEATGKSSVALLLKESLERKGFEVMITREPGGIPSSEAIRANIMDYDVEERTELLLFLAARREHLVKKVIPALKEGKIVISDRFFLSSLVYQGYARGLGINKVRELNAYACDGVFPDINLIIDIPVELSMKRKASDDLEVNRLDLEGIEFHQKVREGYLEIVKQGIDPVVLIDGAVSMTEMFAVIENEILARI